MDAPTGIIVSGLARDIIGVAEFIFPIDPERAGEVRNKVVRCLALGRIGRTEQDIAAEIGDGGAGMLKRIVTESVNGYLAPHRERRAKFEADLDYVKDVLNEGNRRMNEIANATLAEVREAMHMVY